MTDPSPADRLPRKPNAPAGTPAGAAVCTACPLLCDDIVAPVGAGPVERACGLGLEAFDRRARGGGLPISWIDGCPANLPGAVAAAAGRLSRARRVLVTGLADTTIEAVRAACGIAEALGGAIAPGGDEGSSSGGSLVARGGEITAAWEEFRDRADLVLFWGHDPALTHPRFIERFVAGPLADRSRTRRTFSVGVECRAPLANQIHLPLERIDDDVTLGRVLLAGQLNRPCGDVPSAIRAAADTLAAAIDQARCVGIVTGRHDPIGLSRWSVVELVRALSRRLPTFEIPLPCPVQGPNAAGAAAVLTWRYGSAGGSEAADPSGAPAQPVSPPTGAVGLVAAGRVDAVLSVGRIPPRLVEALDRHPAPCFVIRIEPGAPPDGHKGVWIRTPETFEQTGTLLRSDGRTMTLAGPPRGDAVPLAVAVLAAIHRGLEGVSPEARP